MDFSHSETRQMLADTLNRWIAQDYPLKDRLEAGQSELGFSSEKWNGLAELGVIGALFSEEDGGFGGEGFDLSVVFEAVGRGLVLEPMLESAVLAGSILTRAGNDGQKAMLGDMIEGKTRAVLAHFEAEDGYDPTWIAARAKRSGDNWVLNGQKSVVRFANSADFVIVSARTSGADGDENGLSLFLLPKAREGLEMREYATMDGGRAAELDFNNVRLDDDALIGAEGAAFATLEHALGRGVLAVSAEAVGIMDVIKEMTIEFIQTRKQFGVPIGKFQALQHRMAEMLLEIEQARSAVINAAALLGKAGGARALSAAKVTIGRVGTLVSEESIQLHGGIGMTWENALGHYAKRLVMIDHMLGDEDYHLGRYIALGKMAAA